MTKSVTPKIPSIDFDLRQLEIFKKVVELESFSKAAQEVYLAQASVSERIANLENAIGTRLLDRLGRRAIPTKAGELLYRHATLLLDMKRSASLEMQDFLGKKRGTIRIGGSTIPGEYILPKIIGRFRDQYPEVAVSLTIGSTSHIEALVLGGELELGIIGSMSSNNNLLIGKLWQDKLVIAVPAGHRWAHRKDISLDELSEEPFILRETGSGTLRIFEEHLRSLDPKGMKTLKVVARLGTSTAVKEGVKAGLGISIISSRALDTEVETGLLKVLGIKGLPMPRSFYVIKDKRRVPSPLCQTMLEFLQSTSKANGGPGSDTPSRREPQGDIPQEREG